MDTKEAPRAADPGHIVPTVVCPGCREQHYHGPVYTQRQMPDSSQTWEIVPVLPCL